MATLVAVIGCFTLLLGIVARSQMPPEYRAAHTIAMAAAIGVLTIGVVLAIKQQSPVRLVRLSGIAWAAAVGVAALVEVVISPTPDAFGRGAGVGLVMGLMAAAGAALVAYAVLPKSLRENNLSVRRDTMDDPAARDDH